MEALRGFSSAPDLCGCSRNFETDSVATCMHISHNYEMSIVFFPQALHTSFSTSVLRAAGNRYLNGTKRAGNGEKWSMVTADTRASWLRELRDQDAAEKSRKPRQCANAEWKLRWRGCPGPGKTEPGQQKDKCNQGKMQRRSPINLNKITS